MGWLGLVTGIMKLASVLAGYLSDRQLIGAGEAQAITEGNDEIFRKIEAVRKARDVLADPASGRADRLRDKYKRD